MKTITYDKHLDMYESPILDFYFKGLRFASLDIETTGLSRSRSRFILGGLYDTASGRFTQILAEDTTEEAEVLQAYLDEVSAYDVVITFNGRHFDVPFLLERYRHVFGQEYPGHVPYDLDLYLVLNGHSPVKKFVPNLKQKTVEAYMGLWDKRTDEISGADSVEMYFEYARTGDEALERYILLHNSDDVLQLARLMSIIAKTDFHKAMTSLGFPVGDFTVTNVKTRRDVLEFAGIQRRDHIDYKAYQLGEYPADITFDAAAKSFRVSVPLIREHGLGIIDLFAAGLDPEEFSRYPSCSSGFLAIEDHSKLSCMETNHFIRSFMHRILRYMGKE